MSPKIMDKESLPKGELLDDDEAMLIKHSAGACLAVELGTYRGRGAAIMSHFAGKVTTVDVFERVELIADEVSRKHYAEHLAKDPRTWEEVKADLQLRYNVTVIQGLTYHAASVYDYGIVDMLFVDADHSYAGAARDFEAWLPHVTMGGRIAFHDSDEKSVWPGVYKFVNELRSDSRVKWIDAGGSVNVFEKVLD